MASPISFLHSQLIYNPPVPTTSWASKTVIVTGSNTGLGREAARHFARLGAERLILAVRSVDKGEDAKAEIEASLAALPSDARPAVAPIIEVWQLDLTSFASVRAFAQRANTTLPRLDVLLNNAGVMVSHFQLVEGHEITITVNVISTFLLSLLLLPLLRRTAHEHPSPTSPPHCVVVSSDMHHLATIPPAHLDEGLFERLRKEEHADIHNRYTLSKLLEVMIVRQMANRMKKESTGVVINAMNPGMCKSDFARNKEGWRAWSLAGLSALLSRTTEAGSRTLLDAAGKGWESHGRYVNDGRVEGFSKYVESEEGIKASEKIWSELEKILEGAQEGILKNLDA